MHHFTSKVSVEKFQGDEHASFIPEHALIDKTSIFSAFDISTTCQYFKVLLFIADTIDMRSEKRKRDIKTIVLSYSFLYLESEKTIFLFSNISRARIIIYQNLKRWPKNFHLRQRARNSYWPSSIHLSRAEKCNSIFQDWETGKRKAATAWMAVMIPEYLMAFVVVDPLEASNTKQNCQLNSLREASGCFLAPR